MPEPVIDQQQAAGVIDQAHKENQTLAQEAATELEKSRQDFSEQVENVFETGELAEPEPKEEKPVEEKPTEEVVEEKGDDLLDRLGIETPAEEGAEEEPTEEGEDPELQEQLAEIEGIEEPPRLSQKSKEGWAALKEGRKEAIKTIHSLRQQVTQLETAQQAAPDADLKAENEALKQQLSVLDFQSSDEFKNNYIVPAQRATEAIDTVLNGKDINAAQLLSLPEAERNAKVDELAEGMPRITAAKLVNLVTGLDDLAEKRTLALQDVDGQIAKMREDHSAVIQEQTAKKVSTFETVHKQFQTDTGALLKPYDLSKATPQTRPYQEAFNQGLEELNERARHLALAEDSPEEIAASAVKAPAFDFLMKHAIPEMGRRVVVLMNEVKSLKGELGKFKVVKPSTLRGTETRKTQAEIDAAEAAKPVGERIGKAISSAYSE